MSDKIERAAVIACRAYAKHYKRQATEETANEIHERALTIAVQEAIRALPSAQVEAVVDEMRVEVDPIGYSTIIANPHPATIPLRGALIELLYRHRVVILTDGDTNAVGKLLPAVCEQLADAILTAGSR